MPYPLTSFEPADFLPMTQYHSRHAVLVDHEGLRFTTESRGDEVSNQATLGRPRSRAVLVFDEAIRAEYAVAAPYPHGQKIDRLGLARDRGAHVAEASTLADLAWRVAAWSLPAERLLASLAAAASTCGPLRVPPLYAVEVQPSITFTFGGLRIDRQGRALDPTGAAIGNLYVVGADAGGVQEVGYIGGVVLGATFRPVVAAAALNARARPRPR